LLGSLGTYGIWQEWWLGTLGLVLFAVLIMGRAVELRLIAAAPNSDQCVRNDDTRDEDEDPASLAKPITSR
jgi:hypothetical protein